MSDLDFTICCTVTFFSKKRRTPPNLNNGKYCPHLVIKGSDQLLGVNFIDGEEVIFDKPIGANALPENEAVDYSILQEGTEFLIMESGNIVGEGIVKKSFNINHMGENNCRVFISIDGSIIFRKGCYGDYVYRRKRVLRLNKQQIYFYLFVG